MENLGDLIEGLIMDILLEGIGATAGIALLWGLFFAGTFTLFSSMLTLFASTI